MKTSARNQFHGQVRNVHQGAINSEVIVDIGGSDQITAVITNQSVVDLGLSPGKDVIALIKASWVILTTSEGLKTSARNQLLGTVKSCTPGEVNTEVHLELPGGKSLTAITTSESVRNLGLQPGLKASALIKASHVILAVEDAG